METPGAHVTACHPAISFFTPKLRNERRAHEFLFSNNFTFLSSLGMLTLQSLVLILSFGLCLPTWGCSSVRRRRASGDWWGDDHADATTTLMSVRTDATRSTNSDSSAYPPSTSQSFCLFWADASESE